MKHRFLELLCCPACRSELKLDASETQSADIKTGHLACLTCGVRYQIADGIPRFVSAENYASNFGLQWNRFRRTQLDKFSGLDLSARRFFDTTAWPRDLTAELVLDAGCGAGRFSDVALRAGAEVVAFDLSDAVDANLANNDCSRLHVLQADITRLPLRMESFDRIYCLGVLQHTPDPRAAFAALLPMLRKGGHIAVDVYAARVSRRPNIEERISGYLRRYTTRQNPAELMRRIDRSVRLLLPLKRFLRHHVPLGRKLNMIIPIKYAWKREWNLSREQALEWSILDTFDYYGARLEHPQSLEEVRDWFRQNGLMDITVKPGANGIIGRATKPA